MKEEPTVQTIEKKTYTFKGEGFTFSVEADNLFSAIVELYKNRGWKMIGHPSLDSISISIV